jgi:hypothetical protein
MIDNATPDKHSWTIFVSLRFTEEQNLPRNSESRASMRKQNKITRMFTVNQHEKQVAVVHKNGKKTD